MFHCVNISKHISISVRFFIISVSCFVFFCWIFENNCPWGARFFCPRGSGFRTFFVPGGWEIHPFKEFPGGWSGLELTDTLTGLYSRRTGTGLARVNLSD